MHNELKQLKLLIIIKLNLVIIFVSLTMSKIIFISESTTIISFY